MLAASAVQVDAAAYTYADLVGQMTDVERLAVLPPAGETSRQWSSWDRRSRYDAEHDQYVNWGVNGDHNGVIRSTNGVDILAEMEGPGCIWRIWSADPQSGRVRIYLDGAANPVVDLPFTDYFTGKIPPFNYPELSYNLKDDGCDGQNLYMPIPYSKSCRIEADKGWGTYYHIGYTTYPQGTTVPTFSAKLASSNVRALRRVCAFFRERLGEDPIGKRPNAQTQRLEAELAPGATTSMEIAGARAVTTLRLVRPVFENREDEERALRLAAIRITFDGADAPQVWCPLGDFFGTAPGWNEYRTLVTGMTQDAAYAHWYMPFAKSATIELVNDDDRARRFVLEATHVPLRRSFEGLGHFHCKWHRDSFPTPSDRQPDWSVLRTQGRGRFLGFMLHVWNPLGGWWGEGDEKFFVDGEKFPSYFGTGSEDYFGYAWCHPGLFSRPYHAQSMTQNNSGHQSVLRWHLADNVPFQREFDGYIEYYNGKPTEYAATVCWYLAPGGTDSYPTAVPAETRHGYCVPLPRSAGGFKLLGHPPGEVITQKMAVFGKGKWTNDDQLWWIADRPGVKLEIALKVPEDGTYRLSGVFTRASEYGIVQLHLDGKKAGERIDLYARGVEPTEPIPLGVHKLSAGEHAVTVEMVGINENAYKRYMFGLDSLLLDRVDTAR